MCRSAERVAALDAGLWECSEPDFLPHGTAADGDADLQPIWISQEDEPPPNGARFLFLVDGREAARVDAFGRVFDLFDGNNEASVQAARERWKAAKSAGHDLTYWQQGPGGWEKKAESRAA
jgi:DNA polymerase-3 subunit chi